MDNIGGTRMRTRPRSVSSEAGGGGGREVKVILVRCPVRFSTVVPPPPSPFKVRPWFVHALSPCMVEMENCAVATFVLNEVRLKFFPLPISLTHTCQWGTYVGRSVRFVIRRLGMPSVGSSQLVPVVATAREKKEEWGSKSR